MHAAIKVITQNHIFVNVTNGTETKQRFVRNEYHTLDISYIFAYRVHFMFFWVLNYKWINAHSLVTRHIHAQVIKRWESHTTLRHLNMNEYKKWIRINIRWILFLLYFDERRELFLRLTYQSFFLNA